LPTLRRGDLYLAQSAAGDPRRERVFVIVGRDSFLGVGYSSALCAPVYSNATGVDTEVRVGEAEGLKRPSWIRCDELTSVLRSRLTHYLGSLPPDRIEALDRALAVALGIDYLFDD
jgi:mRNA interferase MazF